MSAWAMIPISWSVRSYSISGSLADFGFVDHWVIPDLIGRMRFLTDVKCAHWWPTSALREVVPLPRNLISHRLTSPFLLIMIVHTFRISSPSHTLINSKCKKISSVARRFPVKFGVEHRVRSASPKRPNLAPIVHFHISTDFYIIARTSKLAFPTFFCCCLTSS
jgi:hypothetical protein